MGNLTAKFNTSNLLCNFHHRKQNSFDRIVANFPSWLLNVRKRDNSMVNKKNSLKHIYPKSQPKLPTSDQYIST